VEVPAGGLDRGQPALGLERGPGDRPADLVGEQQMVRSNTQARDSEQPGVTGLLSGCDAASGFKRSLEVVDKDLVPALHHERHHRRHEHLEPARSHLDARVNRAPSSTGSTVYVIRGCNPA
jgi:hypothetical protein